MKLKLKDIRLDGGTQPRQFINQDVVNEYAEDMVETDNFPPMIVFNDGANYWLADGFHRYHANKKAGFVEVNADVRSGTLREAILFSVGANASHGLRRTNDDKRKAVTTMLQDIEWGEWSDREIATQCMVSHVFVARVRKSLGLEKTEKKYINKHGQEAKMNTENRKPSEPVILKPSEAMDNNDVISEQANHIVDMANEIEELKARLAVGLMDGTEEEKAAASETIDSLRMQLKTLTAELDAVKISRDTFQKENAELKKQVAYYRKRCEKAEKLAA